MNKARLSLQVNSANGNPANGNPVTSECIDNKYQNRTKGRPITIGGKVIKAGQKKIIPLPIANLYTNNEMRLPVHVINGRYDGPRIVLTAAIHGDELNGVEIVRRLLAYRQFSQLRGTLICIPFVNGFGLIQHSRYLPDGRDLNRCFPGSDTGSLAARLSHILLQEIVNQCQYGIDMHTGAQHRTNLPQIRANLDDEETERLARAFGTPVLINANLRDGSIRSAAAQLGVKLLLYEAGEALRLDELSIRAGMKGIVSVMRALAMLPPSRKEKDDTDNKYAPFIARSSSWMRAPASGLFRTGKKLGDQVIRGGVLGNIFEPSQLFEQIRIPVTSRYDGIIIGKTNIPLVNEGDALFHIARFEADANEVEAGVEEFQQEAWLPH